MKYSHKDLLWIPVLVAALVVGIFFLQVSLEKRRESGVNEVETPLRVDPEKFRQIVEDQNKNDESEEPSPTRQTD